MQVGWVNRRAIESVRFELLFEDDKLFYNVGESRHYLTIPSQWRDQIRSGQWIWVTLDPYGIRICNRPK